MLVLQAHPVEASYNAALLRATVALQPDATVVQLYQGDELTAAALTAATELIAVYPTWWGSPPAIMLAALNEVLGPWIDGGEPKTTCPLRSIESVTVVTTHGSSKLVNSLQGEPGLRAKFLASLSSEA